MIMATIIVMPNRPPAIMGSTGVSSGESVAGVELGCVVLSDGTVVPSVDGAGSDSVAGILSLAAGMLSVVAGMLPGVDSVAGGATGVVVAGGLVEGAVVDWGGFVEGCVGFVVGFVAEGFIT